MSLATNVRELREEMGMNQAALARKSNITQATISRIESGRVTQPKISQLRKLAKALDTTIDRLIADVPEVLLDDFTNDREWQRTHKGWNKLSLAQRRHIANTVRLFGEDREKHEDG